MDAQLTELGATATRWRAHHAPDTQHDPATDFLPRTSTGVDRFTGVALQDDRVYGFVMHFDPNALDEAHATLLAKQELPPDAQLVFDAPLHAHAVDSDDQCVIQQYRSAVLSEALASDPDGLVLVTLSEETPDGFQPYDPRSIITVTVLAGGSPGHVPGEC